MMRTLALLGALASASALLPGRAPRAASGAGRLHSATAPPPGLVNPDLEFLPLSRPESEHLIGEEMVTDDASASFLADRCITEAERLFTSTEGWQQVLEEDGVVVETKKVHGPYDASGVDVVRGVGIIDASMEKFYEFQISREGFQSIDEYLVNHRLVAQKEWKSRPEGYSEDDYDLMVNRVEWKYPFKRREFVALDIVDRPRKILISKSCLHPDRPGGSRYQSEVPLDEKEFVRAVQYYASKVEPIDENHCKLTMVTWGEMCDSYSAWWVNQFNAHVFITPKFRRFKRVMEGEYVYEESNIMDNAWSLIKLIPGIKPDLFGSKGSDFTKMNKRV